MSITQDLVKELFEYKDGFLYWKITKAQNAKKGTIAGSVDSNGYHRVSINYKHYKVHRLVFLMFHGFLPENIDHIDGNPLNNKIENLRKVTTSQNMQNAKRYSTNTSGVKGVSWEKDRKKWKVQVMLNRENNIIRNLESLELAELVAQELRNKYHGEFTNHG